MPHVIMAPFSNNDLRDWPLKHYARLIALLTSRGDITVEVIGTAAQRERAAVLVLPDAGDRVVNSCGRIAWSDCAQLCQAGDCVVGNNSGVAHLAARAGATVVCVFGGAHDRSEWAPVGPSVTVISRAVACSPCHLSRAVDCSHALGCLAGILPEEVAHVVLAGFKQELLF